MEGLEIPMDIGYPKTILKGVSPCLLFGVFWIFIRAKGKASGHLSPVSWQIFPNVFLCLDFLRSTFREG